MLEAKAKNTKKIRGQGPKPRTEPLQAKDSNAQGQGPRTQAQSVLQKKKGLQNFFSGDLPIYWRTQNFWLGEA